MDTNDSGQRRFPRAFTSSASPTSRSRSSRPAARLRSRRSTARTNSIRCRPAPTRSWKPSRSSTSPAARTRPEASAAKVDRRYHQRDRGWAAGQKGTEYDFGEYLLAPGYLSKRLALASTPTSPGTSVAQQIPRPSARGPTRRPRPRITRPRRWADRPCTSPPSATIAYPAGGDLASLTVTITNLKDGSSEGLFIPGQTIGAVSRSRSSLPCPPRSARPMRPACSP